MASPTESYVDPSINADTGAGSVGDPAGDLQGWLNRMTPDATNGDRINIKAGTAEVLSAALSLTTYGAPTGTSPLVFQGYNTTAGDGGQAEIDCNTYQAISSGTLDFIGFINIDFSDWPSASPCIFLDDGVSIINCKFDASVASNVEGVETDLFQLILNCEFTGFAGTSNSDRVIQNTGSSTAIGNFIEMDAGTAFYPFSGSIVSKNIIVITGTAASYGIQSIRQGSYIGNSIYCSAANTGVGIYVGSTASDNVSVIDNIVEGFSGTGGIGIESVSGMDNLNIGGNSLYNNATNITTAGGIHIMSRSNESLGSTAFAKSGSGTTFSNRFTYYAPLDVGEVWGGSIDGNLDRGAVQRAAGGGGSASGVRNPLVGPIG